ncbi:MAG: hypothetical protein JOZ17_07705 [Acetobacteraceae bacterium]|nr:hypothetical protein [Acetobacteraceae bacterium]
MLVLVGLVVITNIHGHARKDTPIASVSRATVDKPGPAPAKQRAAPAVVVVVDKGWWRHRVTERPAAELAEEDRERRRRG